MTSDHTFSHQLWHLTGQTKFDQINLLYIIDGEVNKFTIGVPETIINLPSGICQIACLSDNNEVWSDRLSDQRIRRESTGLSCICLVDCESDHECQINFVYGLT